MVDSSKNFLDFKLLPDIKEIDSRRGSLWYVYRGNSMAPTLREPELMEVKPYRSNMIMHGDVVCFYLKDGFNIAVHRVVNIDERGVITRGDNNDQVDGWIKAEKDIIGSVIAAGRGMRRRRILGGWSGYLYAWTLYGLRHLDWGASRLLSRLYHWFSLKGFFAKLLPLRLHPRIVHFQADGKTQLFLFWMGIMIGRYVDANDRWVIRRPYKLIADNRKLLRCDKIPPPKPSSSI